MEAVRIVESRNKNYMVAFCNPIMMQANGVTFTTIQESIEFYEANENTGEFFLGFMDEVLFPFFTRNTEGQYKEYTPVDLELRQMDHDMILPIIQFRKKETIMNQTAAYSDTWKDVCEQAIQNYISDFEKEYPAPEEMRTRLISFPSLMHVTELCKRMGEAACKTSALYQYRDRYYVVFTFYVEDTKAMMPAIRYGIEYGRLDNPAMYDHVREHGDLILEGFRRDDKCMI